MRGGIHKHTRHTYIHTYVVPAYTSTESRHTLVQPSMGYFSVVTHAHTHTRTHTHTHTHTHTQQLWGATKSSGHDGEHPSMDILCPN